MLSPWTNVVCYVWSLNKLELSEHEIFSRKEKETQQNLRSLSCSNACTHTHTHVCTPTMSAHCFRFIRLCLCLKISTCLSNTASNISFFFFARFNFITSMTNNFCFSDRLYVFPFSFLLYISTFLSIMRAVQRLN